MPGSRHAALLARLADAVAARGARRATDAQRVAGWRLEAGGAADPALLTRAARDAFAAVDGPRAARLAEAAVRAGGGADARLVLGRALAATGRAEEAEAVLAAEPGREAVMARARNLFWGLGRHAEADALLAAGGDPELTALRARLAGAAGRSPAALTVALPLLADARAPETARLHAAMAAGEALIACGRAEQAGALVAEWVPAAVRRAAAMPWAEPVLRSMQGYALRSAGRPAEAIAVHEGVYEASLRLGSGEGVRGRGGHARLRLARARARGDGAPLLPRERDAAARR